MNTANGELPIPTIGRIVRYRLSATDASEINGRRTSGRSVWERLQTNPPTWPTGAQAHIGNEAHEGDVHPMIIVRVWGVDSKSYVNGQVFLDGNDQLWVTSVQAGEGPRTFSWPDRS